MASAKDEKLGKDSDVQDHWYLVDTHGQKFRLPKTMLFLGREECDVVVSSQSVDKRHAVLTFDLYLNRFKVKDLSTTNGTFVNNSRITEEEYITLNHMDSIRLGQDAMMYHIEQGSQIATVGGQLPDPHYIPSWASRAQDSSTIHVHAHTLAECQGCIAEQKLDHTCGLNHERRCGSDAHHHCEHHHHQQHQAHSREQHQHSVQSYSKTAQHSNGAYTNHNRRLSDQLQQIQPPFGCVNHDVAHDEDLQISATDNLLTQHPDVPVQNTEAPPIGRNTWPKKRQIRKTVNVETVFNSEVSDNPNDASGNHSNQGDGITSAAAAKKTQPSNGNDDTAPQHSDTHPPASVTSEAYPAGAVQAMYFVTFDDSLCNTDASSAGDKERRSRITRNSAPNELATVKKGTPLYGQPSWWGEMEDVTSCSVAKSDGDNKNNSKISRPTKLGLGEHTAAKKSEMGSKSGIVESGSSKLHSNSTYMEIPIKNDDSPVRAENIKDMLTPAKSISSSLSKDSLSVSPELIQPKKNTKNQSPNADLNTSMSFTIDLDDSDHPPKKPLNISSSISEFVPSKIRKNFRERKTMSSKNSSKESTPSKNSEDHDLSPLSQRKIEEVWNTASEGKGRSWLSSVQANVGSSLRSPNLEEIDRLSEFSDDRRSLDREAEKKGSLKKPVASKSPQISSKTVPPSSTGSSSKNQVNVNQYADPTSYLIDKMFEGGSSGSILPDKQDLTEQKLYKEAANYDKVNDNRRSVDKSLARPTIDTVSRPKIDTVSSSSPTTAKNIRKVAVTKTIPSQLGYDNNLDDNDDDNDLLITEDIPVSENKLDEKEDKDDKASEAGTYTIEADVKEGEDEEEEARKRIDQVFGVDVDSLNTDLPVIDLLRLASPGGYDNVLDFDNEDDDDDDDGERTPLDESCQSPAGIDTDVTADDGDDDEESSDMAATDGVEMWVSQLTALSNHKLDTNRAFIEEGETSLSKKPPQGISRKRPGTGRKLPSIPSDKSPVNSEHSSHNADYVSANDIVTGRVPNHSAVTNGRTSVDSYRPSSSQSRSSKATSNGLPSSPGASSRSRGSVDTETLLHDTETAMAAIQARISHKSGQCRNDSYSQDSDTDASSTIALVNGDDNNSRSRQYKSPREILAQRHNKNDLSLNKSNNSSSSVPVKKPVAPTYSQTVPTKSMASPRSTPSSNSTTRKSIVSDVVSRRDSMDNDSIISDLSSDTGNGHHSRSPSKGKSSITMTRTNKTFDLRRARVDSFDEPTIQKSVKSSVSSRSNASSYGRSQSLHSTTRNTSLSATNRSGVSLGAQIVKKSQSNMNDEKVRKPGKIAVSRTDSGGSSGGGGGDKNYHGGSSGGSGDKNYHGSSSGGGDKNYHGSSSSGGGDKNYHGGSSSGSGDKNYHGGSSGGGNKNYQNHRLQHSVPLPATHSVVANNINNKKEVTQKIQERQTPINKAALVITGISNTSSRSQSQPGSRSNSPKSAEKLAWKRRKEYDARKSVADAKAVKTKDGSVPGVTMRQKTSSSSIRRRMIRSASFTNSAGLSLGLINCGSSSQDLSGRRDSCHEHEEFRRAFIPFHSSVRNERSTHSADEDDSLISANSTQDFARSLASILANPSAFTPPPNRNKPESPEVTPPSKAYLSLRRRTLNMEGMSTHLQSNGLFENSKEKITTQNTHQTSYDSLIVASIYQLSLKLKTATDKTLGKLRDQNRVSHTPSPIDDFLSDSSKSEIPAWKTANQELAGTLKNLRKLERHVHMMNTVIFPDVDVNSEVSSHVPASRQVKQKLLEDIERKFGFQPIDHPHVFETDAASPEMAELSGQF